MTVLTLRSAAVCFFGYLLAVSGLQLSPMGKRRKSSLYSHPRWVVETSNAVTCAERLPGPGLYRRTYHVLSLLGALRDLIGRQRMGRRDQSDYSRLPDSLSE